MSGEPLACPDRYFNIVSGAARERPGTAEGEAVEQCIGTGGLDGARSGWLMQISHARDRVLVGDGCDFGRRSSELFKAEEAYFECPRKRGVHGAAKTPVPRSSEANELSFDVPSIGKRSNERVIKAQRDV